MKFVKWIFVLLFVIVLGPITIFLAANSFDQKLDPEAEAFLNRSLDVPPHAVPGFKYLLAMLVSENEEIRSD